MNFDKQTDILIVVTLNHSFFYSPKNTDYGKEFSR